MLKIVALLAVIASAFSATLPNDQRTQQLNGRIIGGANTTIAAFPWQVSLQINGTHACGASIYSNNIIITAAHCLDNTTPNMMNIRAGSTYWNSDGTLVNVAAFKSHEKFDEPTSSYDIAVLRLETSLNFSTAIRPISLTSESPKNGANAVVTGWGTTFYGASDIPLVLQYINVKIIDTIQCASPTYNYGNGIDLSMICAASPGKDPCQRDSGGPMVSDGMLVGVVSWGTGCGVPRFPGVYANVAVLKDWIDSAALSV